MYQFSRAIYRELAPQIVAPAAGSPGRQQPRRRASRLRGRRHAHGDRPPLLRPARAHAVLRHPQLLPDVRAGARPQVVAATSARRSSSSRCTRTRATRPSAARRRSAAPRPAKAPPASACRSPATATAPPTSTSRTPRTASCRGSREPSRVGSPGNAPGGRRRRHLHRRRAVVGEARVHTAKVPSTPAEQSRGVLEAVAAVLDRAGARAEQVRRFAHGMTVATNALLEGRTARTALIATAGFTDVIELGRQDRPHLYRLCDAAPAPLVPAELRFGAPERVGPDGTLRELDPDGAPARSSRDSPASARRRRRGAPSLLRRPRSRAAARRALRRAAAGPRRLPVAASSSAPSASSSAPRRPRSTPRSLRCSGPTCARSAPARRAPACPSRDHAVQRRAHRRRARRRPRGADRALRPRRRRRRGAAAARAAPASRTSLCFDMGGTSCDVCLIDGGEVRETAERAIAGRPLSLPALDIHTVGAGGGSIAWRDPGGALRVGPASAGAEPGPACYGRGGPQPTVTDANLLLGRLLEDSPLAGGLALDRAGAPRRVASLARARHGRLSCAPGHRARGRGRDAGCAAPDDRRAGDRSAPLRAHAVRRRRAPARGRPRQELGVERILCPRTSGVLCALGLAAAAPRRDAARTVMMDREQLDSAALEREREEPARRGALRRSACEPAAARAGPPRAALPRPVVRAARRRRAHG